MTKKCQHRIIPRKLSNNQTGVNLLESIYKYVTQLANAQRRLIERLAKEKTYSGTQGKVIHYLFANKENTVYQKHIERDFGMRASTATELIHSLEKMEMVRRVPSKKDGRYKEILLTEKAITLRDDVSADMNELEQRMKKNLSDEELLLWVKVTCKMLDNLKGAEE